MNVKMNWRDSNRFVKDKLNYALKNDKMLHDIVIIAGFGSMETRIKGHSFMLFIGSQVFEELLEKANINSDGMGELYFPDVSPAAMQLVLKHIYTDCVDLDHVDVIDILDVGLKFQLHELTTQCVSKLKNEINAENVLKLYDISDRMEDFGLKRKCQDIISINAGEIFQSKEFLQLSSGSVHKLLELDELHIDEISLFSAITRWGKKMCERLEIDETFESLRLVLKDIIPLIRFPLMTSQEFSSVVLPTNMLSKEEIIDVYLFLSMKSSKLDGETVNVKSIFSSSERFVKFKPENSTIHNNIPGSITTNTVESTEDRKNGFGCKIIRKQELLKYLKNISGSKTISGLYIYDSSNDRNVGIETIQNISGVNPGILTLAMPSYLDTFEKWQSFTDEIIFNWNNGYLVNIVWRQEQHPLANIEQFRMTDEMKWKSLIKDGDSLNYEWKQLLDHLVPYLLRLQNAGVVTICDLLPFINCKTFLWRGRPGMNGTLKLFQVTHDYLSKYHDLDSLIWSLSLSTYGDMTNLEEYWPGKKYVDVISVYMGGTKELEMNVYQKLLNIARDKPISMENIYTVPKPEIIALQPRWTWFTVRDILLQNETYNNDETVKSTFQDANVINKENIDFV